MCGSGPNERYLPSGRFSLALLTVDCKQSMNTKSSFQTFVRYTTRARLLLFAPHHRILNLSIASCIDGRHQFGHQQVSAFTRGSILV